MTEEIKKDKFWLVGAMNGTLVQNGGHLSVAVNDKTGEKVEVYNDGIYLIDIKTGEKLNGVFTFQHEQGLINAVPKDVIFLVGFLIGVLFGMAVAI